MLKKIQGSTSVVENACGEFLFDFFFFFYFLAVALFL